MVGKKLKAKTMANKKYYENAKVPGDRLMGRFFSELTGTT